MGEIFHALEVLNRQMKLGLSGQQLLRAEMGFKSALAMQGNPAATTTKLASTPGALAERYELKATLRRRSAKLSLNQLASLANQAVRTPRMRVDAATVSKVDTAIGAATRVASTGVSSIGARSISGLAVAKRRAKKAKRKKTKSR
jgi:hypothetical protein